MSSQFTRTPRDDVDTDLRGEIYDIFIEAMRTMLPRMHHAPYAASASSVSSHRFEETKRHQTPTAQTRRQRSAALSIIMLLRVPIDCGGAGAGAEVFVMFVAFQCTAQRKRARSV